jgi:hypothetical protein
MYNLSHRHGLNDIASYEVVQTIEAGERIADRVVQRFEGASSYINAVDAAREIRRPVMGAGRAWAVIYPVYTDGCRSEAPF